MKHMQLLGRKSTVLSGAALLLFMALPCALRLWTDAGLKPASRALLERGTHIQWAQLFGMDIATSLAAEPIALAQLAVLSVTLVPYFSVFLARGANVGAAGNEAGWRRWGGVWGARMARMGALLLLSHGAVAAAVAWKLGPSALGFALHGLVGSLVVASFYSALGLAVAGWVRRPVWSVVLCVLLLTLLFALRASASARGAWLLVPAANDGFLIAGSSAELLRSTAILMLESCGLLLVARWGTVRRRGRSRAGSVGHDALATEGKGAWV